MRKKLKFLVRWKGYTIEEDTWEGLDNLRDAINLVKEFEKGIKKKKIRRVQIKKEKRKKRVFNPEAEIFREVN